MNDFEKELLNDEKRLSCLNNLLFKYQFSEEFLIETRIYYDSWKCLRSQKNLSPYFCFYYLYDRQEYDSADDWTDYNQVYDYLIKNNDINFITREYNRAINNRELDDRD
jgi:hypothetical protein